MLKPSAKILKHDENNIYFNFNDFKINKIASRVVPMLLNKNKFNSIGYGVLQNLRMLEKESIDPYYMIRGEVAEYFTKLYMIKEIRKGGVEPTIKSYTPQGENFDMFVYKDETCPKSYKFFSGVIDLEITEPQHIVIEVKSKDIEKYQDFKNHKDLKPGDPSFQKRSWYYSEEEVMQGKTLTVLKGSKLLFMIYVFPKKHVEQFIKNEYMVNPTKWNNSVETFIRDKKLGTSDFEFIVDKHIIDTEKFQEDMNQAFLELRKHYTNGFIPKSLFLQKELENLLPEIYKANIDDGLPF